MVLCAMLSVVLAVAGPSADAQTAHPADSCIGTNACTDLAFGDVGAGSCVGEFACHNAAGPIGAGSCLGNSVCQDAGGAVGAGSCNSSQACYETGGPVGAGSCNGGYACYQAGGAVGAGSCLGPYACPSSSGPIGDCKFNFVYVDADCDGAASGVDCDDADASVITPCAPAAAYAGPFTVSPEPVGGPSGLGTDPSPSPAATEPAAEPAAEPVPAPGLAFTGATSTTLTFVALGLIGAGAMLAPASRRRR